MVSRRLVEKLICPLSGAKLVVSGDYLVSTDMVTRLKYPVVKGIPVLLSEEAVEMTEAEWLKATQKQEG